jgi:pSer/pThr/pTyr-binding forkhead associated (FHA) protein
VATLVYLAFRGGLSVFEIKDGVVTLGRSRRCSLSFPHDENQSREHAEIRRISEDQYVLKDLESKNGTFVNDVLVSTRILRHGDRIRIGNAVLTFKV